MSSSWRTGILKATDRSSPASCISRGRSQLPPSDTRHRQATQSANCRQARRNDSRRTATNNSILRLKIHVRYLSPPGRFRSRYGHRKISLRNLVPSVLIASLSAKSVTKIASLCGVMIETECNFLWDSCTVCMPSNTRASSTITNILRSAHTLFPSQLSLSANGIADIARAPVRSDIVLRKSAHASLILELRVVSTRGGRASLSAFKKSS